MANKGGLSGSGIRASCVSEYFKVFEDYTCLTKKYGEAGNHISKMWFYEQVAVKNSISISWCRKIVSFMLRNEGKVQSDLGE